jgi:NADPH:quinone reductase-like Zn-dependent oxidoreductase
MKAMYITEHGGTEVLTYGDLPDPLIGPNDVRVRVRACAVNRVDVFTRMGVRGTRLPLGEPHVLGGDAAGDVAEVGSEVTMVRVGDRVVVNPKLTCGQCQYCIAGDEELCIAPGMLGQTRSGSYAEYVTAPAANAVQIPDTISYEEAASLPTVFMPSWNILVRRAALKPWETVLVLSASSGVGSAAIQVAKNVIGARVIATTSSPEKASKAKELGADEVIDYTTEDLELRVKQLTDRHGANVVLDHVGAEFFPAAHRALAPGGRYGICGVTTGYKAELQMGTLFLRNQTVFGVFMSRKEDLRLIVEMVARGTLRGVIHDTFPLKDAARAHQTMEDRAFFGKLILTVP